MVELITRPSTATQVFTEAGNEVRSRNASAQPKPMAMPMAPPMRHCSRLSARNWRRISDLRGAHRAAHADLARTLGDAHQHHVHDDDSAHHRRDGAHHHEHREERSADALPQRDITLRGADEEAVVFARRVVTARCA